MKQSVRPKHNGMNNDSTMCGQATLRLQLTLRSTTSRSAATAASGCCSALAASAIARAKWKTACAYSCPPALQAEG